MASSSGLPVGPELDRLNDLFVKLDLNTSLQIDHVFRLLESSPIVRSNKGALVDGAIITFADEQVRKVRGHSRWCAGLRDYVLN